VRLKKPKVYRLMSGP